MQPLPPVVTAPPETQPPAPAVPSAQPPTVTQGPGLSTPGPLFPPAGAPATAPRIAAPPAAPVTPPTLSTAPALQPPPVVLPPQPAPTPAVPLAAAPVPAPVFTPPVAEAPLLVPAGPPEPPPATGVPEVSQPLRGIPPETAAETAKKVEEEGIYFNVADEDIREVVKQISRALGKNFLLDDKLKGKITIISERKMTKDEVWEAFQSALDVIGFTIVQGPAGLLRIVPIRDAISNPIDLYTDRSPFTDRFITRLITLRNISATDMANVIKSLVSKEGNLFAYPVTNTLILTDSGTNIDRLMRLINELDQEGPQEILEIIPVIYANAKDLAGKITQIFETEKGDAKTSAPPPRPARGAAAGGAEVGTLEEAPRLKKVIPDDRTNSLIILASKIAIRKVRDLIKKLDSPLVGDEGEVHVYYLRYASAKDMATVLNAISGAVQAAKPKSETSKPSGGTAATATTASATSALLGGAEFTGKFAVTADEPTNSLVITAGAKDYNTLLDQVISKLDIPRRQVYVEAVIVELSVSENQQLGAGILGGRAFNVGGQQLTTFGSTFGFLDLNRLLAGTVGAASDQTINVNLPGTPGSTTGSAATTTSVPAFFAAVQFAQNNTDVNILSTPNILTLDNKEAEITIGRKVSFVTQTSTTIGGALQAATSREAVGLTLKIKPQITEGGSITMEVEQKDDDLQPQATDAPGSPTTSNRLIKTSVVAQDGQTIVLGGLIRDRYTTTINKVPGLGDIPLLGYLFKTRRKEKQKVNLLVFMTPHVIREPRDFLAILQKKINEQNAFVDDNFGKSQRKQIRESLARHADHLLEYGAACEGDPPNVRCSREGFSAPLYQRPVREEDDFPMTIDTSSPSVPPASPPSVSSAPSEPIPPPSVSGPIDDAEYSDLAVEGGGRKGKKARKSKASKAPKSEEPVAPSPPADAPAETPPPPSESPAPSTAPAAKTDDIDLAY